VILSIIAVVLAVPAVVLAEEDRLKATLDLTYMSKWMTKGNEGYGQQGAFFKTVDIDFWCTGFGVKVAHRNATAGGYVNRQRFDYRLYYRDRLFEAKPYATTYNISCGYEHYPGLARNKANTTFEWKFAFSWPNIMPEGFVPKYIAHYEYPAGSGYNYAHITGWVHRFILGYDLKVAEFSNPFHLSSELAYTDGLGCAAHDWSYFTTGLSTKLKINDSICFVPGLYHQVSMDDSVCRRDVTYCILSMKYKF
jgi:hypothetical protein